MGNAKSRQSEQAIIEALRACLQHRRLADISVSQLAREAHVSRTTFYAHFDNVAQVYDRAIYEGADSTSTIGEGLAHGSCRAADKTPFCESVRCGGRQTALARDPLYLDTLFSNGELAGRHLYTQHLEDAGLPPYVAEAVCRFQISGCYAAATAHDYTDEEWARCRDALDTFIRAGMEALGASFDDESGHPTSRL